MFFRFLFILLPLVFLNVSYAADEGDWWLQRQIQIGDGKNQYGKKVYGKAARTVIESVPIDNGTREEVRQLIKRSIAVDMPTPSKVGAPMLKRVQAYAKSPGAAFLGTLAVTQLLEAIGWVMKDGTYVKKIKDPNDPSIQYYYKSSVSQKLYSTPKASCDYLTYVGYEGASFSHFTGTTLINCYYTVNGNEYMWNTADRVLNPKYDPNQDPKVNIVPITPTMLGAAMLGQGYQDPDPSFDNSIVNNGTYTGVKETYEHDPSGIGNETAKLMDDKLKNAKPTTDGTSSYIGDPKYDNRPLQPNDDNSDRSWSEDGDTATGETKPDVDPEGNPTGGSSLSLQFPLFCSWASKMCEWYDDWKSSDKVYKDHITEEKSFWDKVKEWFDWSKNEDGLPDRDDSELTVDPQFEQKKVDINWSAECPAPKYETVSLHGYTAQVKVQDFSFLCSLDWLIKPFTIGFASILSIFIIFGFQRGTE